MCIINPMIFLVQFGLNKHMLIAERPQLEEDHKLYWPFGLVQFC